MKAKVGSVGKKFQIFCSERRGMSLCIMEGDPEVKKMGKTTMKRISRMKNKFSGV